MNEDEEEGSGDDEDEEGSGDDDDDDDDDEDDEDGNRFDLATSDPRAGVGDVCLPQLDLNYVRLAEILFKAGSEKKLIKQQRKRLYDLSKRFQLLSNGIYPFAAEINEDGDIVDREAGIEEIDVNALVKKERQEAAKRSEEAEKEREEYRKAKQLARSQANANKQHPKKAEKTGDKKKTPEKKSGKSTARPNNWRAAKPTPTSNTPKRPKKLATRKRRRRKRATRKSPGSESKSSWMPGSKRRPRKWPLQPLPQKMRTKPLTQ